jgi:hypothetical protein
MSISVVKFHSCLISMDDSRILFCYMVVLGL